MSPVQIIAVVGATGHQGAGVVAALLSSTSFSVRALSTNPSGSKGTSLLALRDKYVKEGRLEVVQADLNDKDSLERALKGAYGLFAAMAIAQNEVEQGKTLVDVAKAEGIEHFVYSSLPSIAKASGGKYPHVFPFENKAEIEEYAKEKLDNMTVLIPGCALPCPSFSRPSHAGSVVDGKHGGDRAFYSNFEMPLYARRGDDDTAIFNVAGSPDLQLGWLDDGHDVGTYAAGTCLSSSSSSARLIGSPPAAAFTKGPAATAGKNYPIEAPSCTMKEIAAQYEAVTGEKATVQANPVESAFTGVPEALLPSLTEVFQYMNELGPDSICYGTMKPEEDESFEDLGVKASSFQAFIERTGFRVGAGEK
ncbi:translation initiation factor IF-2 [Rhodotorula toruloides ATCC 204091]|uniref:Translation initiation factor IF-2 n=1 Tax=Rhodotorula toruloides TaxID=5286 RepID=A0A0K3C764_RHOTO|nr:translation initiation factor IF-2 [Rhodotorula toruloides ATCC 204091]PRQ77728.1 translation initiation factor IF-2 [Rhodotorula toruloides]